MRRTVWVLLGLVIGLISGTAAGVWGWGHTPSDRIVNELRRQTDLQERRDRQEQFDRLTGSPCK